MAFPAPAIKLPGMIGMNLRTIFCFGHDLDIYRYGELYGFSYRDHKHVRHINIAGPLLIRVFGYSTVMGYDRMTTGYIRLCMRELYQQELEALQVCRERYMNLGGTICRETVIWGLLLIVGGYHGSYNGLAGQ